jgi:RNA polymerase sigma factor (sigma-70 family)
MAEIQDTTSTGDLVAAARAGDQAAFAALIRRHYPMVHAMCARVLGDDDQARDITQEAAVTAMLGLNRLRHDDRFGAWMAGIGLNLCRRLLRDRDWAVFSLDALLDRRVIGEPAAKGHGPAEAVEAAEIARRVRAAVHALPAGQRQAAEAYYLSNLTQAEAAGHLGIPASAVKTRLHKARAALRSSLSDYMPERHAMTTAPGHMVPMTITGVVHRDTETPTQPSFFIMLTEIGGDRRMWIGVGNAEATALAMSLSGTEQPRPMTYQFSAALLAASGGRLREVHITRLTDDVFFAQAVLANGAAVDARPSDALNLAAVSNAPVYAAEELLEPHARAPAPTGTASTVTMSVCGTAPNDPGPAHQPPEPEPPDASTPAGPAN